MRPNFCLLQFRFYSKCAGGWLRGAYDRTFQVFTQPSMLNVASSPIRMSRSKNLAGRTGNQLQKLIRRWRSPWNNWCWMIIRNGWNFRSNLTIKAWLSYMRKIVSTSIGLRVGSQLSPNCINILLWSGYFGPTRVTLVLFETSGIFESFLLSFFIGRSTMWESFDKCLSCLWWASCLVIR